MALTLAALLLSIQVVLLIGIAIFVVRMILWVVTGELDAPFVPTPVRYAEHVTAALEIAPGDVVYELGCGDGRFMLALAQFAPEATFVGIERNLLLYAVALFRRRRAGYSNASFRRSNFFDVDFSGANKVYAYLLDSAMHKLQPKFEREFKGRVASRTFPFTRKEMSNAILLTERIGAHGQHLLFIYDFE